jgi:DNA primase
VAARFGMGYAPGGWRHLSTVFGRYDDPLLTESGLVIVQSDGPNASPSAEPAHANPDERKRYDRFRDRIMFPIRDLNGQTIGFGGRVLDAGEPKYLNSPETPVFVKGRELYGLFEARKALRELGYALVVEGYMDVVALAQWGLPNAVATLGTACTDDHVRKLLRFTDTVVFSFDGDAAGRKAAARALEAALPHASDTRAFKFLFLPPEHDPDSYIRAHGTQAFEALVSASVPLSRQLVENAAIACDLKLPEGRARFLAQAKPLWQALPTGTLAVQLLRELASMGQLDVPALEALWRVPGDAPTGARRDAGARSRRDSGFDGPSSQPRNASHPAVGTPSATSRLRVPMRSPADSVARLVLLRNDWWLSLSEPQRDVLSRSGGWHAELFAWLDRHQAEHGSVPWASLRVALAAAATAATAGQPWAHQALALVDATDAAFEPLHDDLHRAVEQLQQGVPFKLPGALPGSSPSNAT